MSLFHPEKDVLVKIDRDPPRRGKSSDNVIKYSTTVTELERLYTEMVRNAKANFRSLQEAIDGYDENVSRLMSDLATTYSESGLDNSGVGGKVQEHQDKLRSAAFTQQEKFIMAWAEREKLAKDIRELEKDKNRTL